MTIREYQEKDCKELVDLFYQTVHTINAQDYTEEQVSAWATGNIDLLQWNSSLQEHYTLVAIEGDIITGFGDIDRNGYLDRLYVHKDYQRKRIASALCEALEDTAQGEIVTHASITARPFFEKRGYVVVKEQQVERRGVMLTNYVMIKHR